MLRTLFLSCLVFSTAVFAHGPDYPWSKEGQEQVQDALAKYLENVFIEVSEEVPAGKRFFTFVAPNGEKFYVDSNHLSNVLLKSVEGIDLHPPSEPPAPQSWLRRMWEKSMRYVFDPRTPGKKPNVAVRLIRHQVESLAGAVRAAPGAIRKMPGAVAELAGLYGLIPTIFVIGTTWPPFTLISEKLENDVMLGAHWYCQASQIAYFAVMGFIMLDLRVVRDVVLNRGSSLGVWQRLQQIFTSRVEELRFRKVLKEIYVKHPTPFSMSQASYQRTMHPHGLVPDRLSDSLLWADQYAAMLGDFRASLSKVEKDAQAFFLAPHSAAHIEEWFSGMEVLVDLVRHHLVLARNLDQISRLQFITRKNALGRVRSSLHFLRRTLWLARAETNERYRAGLADWLKPIHADIYQALKLVFSSTHTEGNATAEARGAAARANTQIARFRKGLVEGCQDALVQRGLPPAAAI